MASSSERREEKQPWSELPTDLLQLIFTKLRLISDCIRFRTVCKSWRFVSQLTAGSILHPQLPLLLLPYNSDTNSRSFFSLSTNCIHTISLPHEVRCKKILASSHGWLLLLDYTTEAISLMNPITGAQIQLPPLPNFCETEEDTGSDGRILSSILPHKGAMSSSPSSAEHDCVVITIRCRCCDALDSDVNFCSPGDEVWRKLKTPPGLDFVMYNKGRFYALEFSGVLTVYDAHAPSTEILSLPAPASFSNYFLVKASEAELLLVAHSLMPFDGKTFRLFKMDLSGRLLEWSEIDSIGDRALFLTGTQRSGFMVCARDLPGCREDCIYFVNSLGDFHRQCHIMRVFNIKDGSYQIMRCEPRNRSEYLMGPTWFTPSLH